MGPSSQGANCFFFCPDALPCVRRCSWWVPAVRGANRFFVARTHFLACEDVTGGSQQSGGNVFFAKYGGPSGGSQQSGANIFLRNMVARPMGPSSQGETFFLQNTGGPSGGSLLSGGGINILRVIRRHFLAAAVDPAVSLSTYSRRLMEAVP